MDIDASTRVPREPVASRDTALACLANLAVQSGLDPTVATARRGDVLDGDTLPISRLVEVAGDFELQAEYARVDWQGLQAIGFADPILVLLQNTNVVILMGGGRGGAEEVAVWDPLHRDSELLFVPRREFERAWSGDVLRVTSRLSRSPSSSDLHRASELLPYTEKQQQSRSAQQLFQLRRFCLVATAIMATVGGGLFLFMHTSAENFTPMSIKTSEAVAEATLKTDVAPGRAAGQGGLSVAPWSAPTNPNMAQSDAAAILPQREGELSPDETDRFAALPPAPATTGEVRASEPSLTVYLPVAPPVPEAGMAAEPNAPILPSVDAALSAAEIDVLLTRGDKSFSSGDVASARLYYGRAANAGDGQAALRLGETFDPLFLERAHLRSARGDLPAAVSWYRRAREMGAAEADVLLDSLEAK